MSAQEVNAVERCSYLTILRQRAVFAEIGDKRLNGLIWIHIHPELSQVPHEVHAEAARGAHGVGDAHMAPRGTYSQAGASSPYRSSSALSSS